jgi:hypothetical protein
MRVHAIEDYTEPTHKLTCSRAFPRT